MRARPGLTTSLRWTSESRLARICAAASLQASTTLVLLQALPAWQPAFAQSFADAELIEAPAPDHFSVCYGQSCREIVEVGLRPTEWERVRDQLSPPSRDAAGERARLAGAIALLEDLMGARTGTSADLGGTFAGAGKSGQMDCVDEATNTTTYLRMMDSDGLLRWHTVEDHAVRGFFIFGWPHVTAVIRETQTGQRFAVDSWFHHNGVAPEILPLKTWRSGWRPD